MNRRNFLVASSMTLVFAKVGNMFSYWKHRPEYKPMTYTEGMETIDIAVNKFKPGSLTLLAARPSMGKTTLAYGIGQYITDRRNVSVFYISAYRTIDELPADRFRKCSLMQMSSLGDRDFIGRRCKWKNTRKNIDLIIIDNMTELFLDNETKFSIKKSILWAKSLGLELQAAVMLITGIDRKLYLRNNPRPHVTDLNYDSKLLSQIDSVILLYRDEVYQDSLVTNSEYYDLKGMTEITVISLNDYQHEPFLIPVDHSYDPNRYVN